MYVTCVRLPMYVVHSRLKEKLISNRYNNGACVFMVVGLWKIGSKVCACVIMMVRRKKNNNSPSVSST